MRSFCIKVAALGVALFYVMIYISALKGCENPSHELPYLLALLLPLALIWFPEAIGSATGYIGHGMVSCETPPWLVSFAGWFFLVGLPVIFWLLG